MSRGRRITATCLHGDTKGSELSGVDSLIFMIRYWKRNESHDCLSTQQNPRDW